MSIESDERCDGSPVVQPWMSRHPGWARLVGAMALAGLTLVPTPSGAAPELTRSVMDADPPQAQPAAGQPPQQPRTPQRKSALAAFALEFFLPGAGFLYTDSVWEAGLEVSLFVGGLVLVVENFELCLYGGDCGGNSGLAALGMMMVLGSRVFGLVGAPLNAGSWVPPPRAREDRAQRWRDRPRPSASPLAPPVQAYSLSLPSVSF